MHYSAWGFSRNGFATIVPHVSESETHTVLKRGDGSMSVFLYPINYYSQFLGHHLDQCNGTENWHE